MPENSRFPCGGGPREPCVSNARLPFAVLSVLAPNPLDPSHGPCPMNPLRHGDRP